ncbi:MAG: hypothetical protein R6U96_03135 [Promethearchaeia archaeon]
MFQRKDKNFTWERFYKGIFIITVIALGGVYGWFLTTMMNSKNEFDLFFNDFDVESSLIDEEYIDISFLDSRAQNYEKLIGRYHIPYNMTGEGWDYYPPISITWDYSSVDPDAAFYNNSQLLDTFKPLNMSSPYNNKSLMTYTGDRAHTALYEGVYCAGEAFRYAWAKRNGNEGNMTAAKDRIWKIVKAYDLLSNVSDTSALVRYALPDTEKARAKFPGYWAHEDHYIEEYKGMNWSLSRHISRDVSIGIIYGLSMTYAFVDDAELRETAGRIIDKTVSYWYDCNWRIIDTDGMQHTSGDFLAGRPLEEGGTILTFLQAAKQVKPKKWSPIYKKYAYDRGMAFSIGRTMRMGVDLTPKIFDAYYGCNFLYNNAPTLILLEEDPVLKEIYIKQWLNVLHDFTKLHRNANFDVVYLLCQSDFNIDNQYAAPEQITLDDEDMKIWENANIKKPNDENYVKDFIVRDIKDCLIRYAKKRYPNRNYYFATAPNTFPNVHQQPINLSGYITPYPDYGYWEPTTDTDNLITSMLGMAGRNIEDDGILNASLPVDMRDDEDIMWQRRSFTVRTTQGIESNPGTTQVPMGPEYLSVYWMAKYLEIL